MIIGVLPVKKEYPVLNATGSVFVATTTNTSNVVRIDSRTIGKEIVLSIPFVSSFGDMYIHCTTFNGISVVLYLTTTHLIYNGNVNNI